MNFKKEYDVIIIGAGPSGVKAALKCSKKDLKVLIVDSNENSGGQIYRAPPKSYIKKGKKAKVENSVKKILQEENSYGIKNYKTYQDFAKKVYKIRDNVRRNINNLKEKNSSIVGYGSPAKATTALNFFGISEEIDFIIEDNKLKHGKFLPGMKIPIKSKESLKGKTDYLLVLAWNFFNEIKNSNENLADKFVSIKDLEI